MNTIASVTNAATATQTSSGSSQTSNSNTEGLSGGLSAESFLNLLTVQMQHQDPFNPMDPTQFINQLVQFNQLEQLIQSTRNLRTPTPPAVRAPARIRATLAIKRTQTLRGIPAQMFRRPRASKSEAALFIALRRTRSQIAEIESGEKPWHLFQFLFPGCLPTTRRFRSFPIILPTFRPMDLRAKHHSFRTSSISITESTAQATPSISRRAPSATPASPPIWPSREMVSSRCRRAMLLFTRATGI